MSSITITNLNNIISDYKNKLIDCGKEIADLKSKIRILQIDLKKARKGK